MADLAPQFAQERCLIKRLRKSRGRGTCAVGHFLERITRFGAAVRR